MSDLTIEILKQIRDEIRGTNTRLDDTNTRLDRVVHEQIRHATAIIELAKAQGDFQSEMRSGFVRVVDELHKLNDRINNVLTGALGQTVHATTERVDKLEARLIALERRAG